MKKVRNLFIFILCALMIFAPITTYAEEENENTNEQVETGETEEKEEEKEPEVGKEEPPKEEEKPVVEVPKEEITISLDKTTLTLKVGSSETVKATVKGTTDNVEWSSNDSKIASVKDGKITAVSVGDAIITAKVGDKEATCKVKVEAVKEEVVKGTDATLKSIKITNGTLNQSFSKNDTSYTVTVDKNVNVLTFNDVVLTDSKAGYMISGNNNLINGSIVKITITSEDKKNQNVYKFTIVKDTTNLNLKTLKINGFALNEEFNKDVLNYTADVPNAIDTISLQLEAEDSKNTVSTSNTTNLQVGNNVVKITVKDNNGNSRVYTINVNRSEKTEIEENPTSIITSSSKGTDPITVLPDSGSDNFLKYFIVSLSCLILFAIGGIGIYFYIKTSPKRLKKELTKKVLEKGKEENIEESPIIITDSENTENDKEENKIEVFTEEDLMETKEFKLDEIKEETVSEKDEIDSLFDEEDV